MSYCIQGKEMVGKKGSKQEMNKERNGENK